MTDDERVVDNESWKKQPTLTCANKQCTEASVPNLVLINWLNTTMCQGEWIFFREMSTGEKETKRKWIELNWMHESKCKTLHNYYYKCTISKSHLVPNDKILSYYFICRCLMFYHSVVIVVDALTPSISHW